MKTKVLLFFCLSAILTGCPVDTLSVLEFEIENQHNKPIRVKFTEYDEPSRPVKDTVFTIQPGNTETVYFIDGLSTAPERYLTEEKLNFTKKIEIISDQKISPRDLMLINEWQYERHDSHHESYRVIITSDNFSF